MLVGNSLHLNVHLFLLYFYSGVKWDTPRVNFLLQENKAMTQPEPKPKLFGLKVGL